MNTISTFLHFETWPSRPSNFLINEERESLLWTFPKFCNYCLDSFCHGGSHIGKDSWLELCGNLISALHASKHLPRQHVSSSTPWYRMFGTHQYDAALFRVLNVLFIFRYVGGLWYDDGEFVHSEILNWEKSVCRGVWEGVSSTEDQDEQVCSGVNHCC